MTDTSREAVELLALICVEANGYTLLERSEKIAATLRALLAERDRLRKALNFYACACKYDGEDCDNALDAAYCGRIARAALKGGGDE